MSSDVLFSLPITINYEDTDAAGVVYYANYLAYMERARNAYLRSLGLSLRIVRNQHHVVFAVTEAHLQYHKPAVLDDVIDATLQLNELRGASVEFVQTIVRGQERLVTGRVRLAILRCDTLTPCRMPDILRQALCTEKLQ